MPRPKKNSINMSQMIDSVNPYEYKHGMYYELGKLGCGNYKAVKRDMLEKAENEVVKNLLEKHPAYYSYLTHYESLYKNADKKPTFGTFLKELDKNENKTETIKLDENTNTMRKKLTRSMLEEMVKEELTSFLQQEEEEMDVDMDMEEPEMGGEEMGGGDADAVLRQVFDTLQSYFEDEEEGDLGDIEDVEGGEEEGEEEEIDEMEYEEDDTMMEADEEEETMEEAKMKKATKPGKEFGKGATKEEGYKEVGKLDEAFINRMKSLANIRG